MKMRKTIFTAALAASLTVVLPSFSAAPVIGPAVCEAMVPYENDGMLLMVPGYYDELIYTKVFKEDKEGRLFSCTEAKSVADAWLQNERENGPGWLFTIQRVSKDKLHELLCSEMSGMEVFAKDAGGRYYVFCHPTDVRFVRQDEAAMQRDSKRWQELCEWAGKDVRGEFIETNQGLVPESYDNSNVAIALARVAYANSPQPKYTVSTNQFGPLSPKDAKASKYVEQLIRNVKYEMVDLEETPDGEYVVLNFPKEELRFDFFKLSGKENYVREVHGDGYEILYKATFTDGVTKASSVMQKWYNELAAHR